jgi:IclR family KDG regulon transcriptional repressor
MASRRRIDPETATYVADGQQPGPEGGSVKSANRVLDIIDLLTEHPEGLTFVEMLDQLRFPKSSLHALLRTMRLRGHLSFDNRQRRFRLGVRFWAAGQAFLTGTDLRSIAEPRLERASQLLDETVQLSVLDGLENVYIAKVEGRQALRLVSEVGSRLPAHATGLGKVLLSGLSDEELERRLHGKTLEQLTDRTITNKRRLLREITETRSRGYAIDEGESTPGVFCVAVPVRNHLGETLAAMSSSVPDVRVTPKKLEQMLAVLSEQAKELSQMLGDDSIAETVSSVNVPRAAP